MIDAMIIGNWRSGYEIGLIVSLPPLLDIVFMIAIVIMTCCLIYNFESICHSIAYFIAYVQFLVAYHGPVIRYYIHEKTATVWEGFCNTFTTAKTETKGMFNKPTRAAYNATTACAYHA
jgi:hypothetical protein